MSRTSMVDYFPHFDPVRFDPSILVDAVTASIDACEDPVDALASLGVPRDDCESALEVMSNAFYWAARRFRETDAAPDFRDDPVRSTAFEKGVRRQRIWQRHIDQACRCGSLRKFMDCYSRVGYRFDLQHRCIKLCLPDIEPIAPAVCFDCGAHEDPYNGSFDDCVCGVPEQIIQSSIASVTELGAVEILSGRHWSSAGLCDTLWMVCFCPACGRKVRPFPGRPV